MGLSTGTIGVLRACYVSLGDPDGADFMFAKCDADGNFDFQGVPPGNWKITTFDQWNDQLVGGITTAVALCDVAQSSITPGTCQHHGQDPYDMGEVAVRQWQANISTRTFIDMNYTGVSHQDAKGNDVEPGVAQVATNIRYRHWQFLAAERVYDVKKPGY